ncbi:Putative metal chaperone YciC [bacterium HR16]|nr:Putative metal chaperone YciC [bacterium HR16]
MSEQIYTPKPLATAKPVRLIFVGGFLGAGKTTAMGALARRLLQDGLNVGLVTNDHAEEMVDAALVRQFGMPVAEVSGGCFGCEFNDLLDATERVLMQEPDVLIAEPVASCADTVATVINPLKQFYGSIFRFSPFSVLIDPMRLYEMLLEENPSEFARSFAPIFHRQLEEADILVLNKVDKLSTEETQRLVDALRQHHPSKLVLTISAKRGDGVDEWMNMVMQDAPAGSRVLEKADYSAYEIGGARLGWLNASVQLVGEPFFSAREYAELLLRRLRDAALARGSEVLHIKLAIHCQGRAMGANLLSTDTEPVFGGEELGDVRQAMLVLNARLGIDPPTLGGITAQAIYDVAKMLRVDAEILRLHTVKPSVPCPAFRMCSPV